MKYSDIIYWMGTVHKLKPMSKPLQTLNPCQVVQCTHSATHMPYWPHIHMGELILMIGCGRGWSGRKVACVQEFVVSFGFWVSCHSHLHQELQLGVSATPPNLPCLAPV